MIEQTDLFRSETPKKETFNIESEWLLKRMQEPGGCSCPLCNQHVQVYRRTITASMAKAIILIYRYYQKHDFNKSIQVEGYFKRCNIGSTVRGDFPKLRYWGLIQKADNKRKDGSRRNGHYFFTPRGMSFVKGHIKLEKYAVVYNDTLWKLEGDEIGIKDCLKNKFNYDDLMRGEM